MMAIADCNAIEIVLAVLTLFVLYNQQTHGVYLEDKMAGSN